jgi:hypothetical protein
VITRLNENGKTESHTLEAEYIPIGLSRKRFYERNLKESLTSLEILRKFGVRLKYELTQKLNPILGLNSIQLHYENSRWYIDSWTCEMESEKTSVVTEFMNKY